MAHGKHIAKSPKRRLWPLALVVALVLLVASFGGVVAYLSTSVGPVTNELSRESEKDPGLSQSVVSVGANTGYSVYIRAIPVINWKDASGNVLAEAPVAGTDYTITMNEADWFEWGGFWYYKDAVSPGSATKALISSLGVIGEESGYTLTVDMAAQTIQALGSTDVAGQPYSNGTPAVTDAWGVAVANGKLSIP